MIMTNKKTVSLVVSALAVCMAAMSSTYVNANEYSFVVTNSSVQSRAGGVRSSSVVEAKLGEIQVNSSKPVDDVIADLMESGLYANVEINVPVYTTSFNAEYTNNVQSDVTNDPDAYLQTHMYAPTEYYMGVQDGFRALQLTQQNKRLKVGVIDSGFFLHDDITYTGGFDFINDSNDFLSDENDNCLNSHGTSVAGLITAKTNNGIGIAGMIDADLYAAEALNCVSGSGDLLDVAISIYYLSGITNQYISDNSGSKSYLTRITELLPQPVDIINMSLSGEDACPSYMQDAIDYAVSRGVTVVVAAGNDNHDASANAPANCDNVITVGALNNEGEKSDFSNFGEAVDVSALGTRTYTLKENNEYDYVNGTSFATPITSGAIGMVLQKYPSLAPNTLESIMKLTSQDFRTQAALGTGADAPCANNCGAGVVNAYEALTLINNSEVQNINQAGQAIAMASRTESFLLEHFGAKYDLCPKIEIKTDAKAKGEAIFYSYPLAMDSSDANLTELFTTNEIAIVIDEGDFDWSTLGMAYKVCVGEGVDKFCDVANTRTVTVTPPACS